MMQLLHGLWWLALNWCTLDPTCGSSSLNQDAAMLLYLSPIFALVLLMTDEAVLVAVLVILWDGAKDRYRVG